MSEARLGVVGGDQDSIRRHPGPVLAEYSQLCYRVVVATLHLRNVPPEIDAALTADAKARGLSKNRRSIEALSRGLGFDQLERARLIDEIRRERRSVDLDLAAMIRKDRPAGDG